MDEDKLKQSIEALTQGMAAQKQRPDFKLSELSKEGQEQWKDAERQLERAQEAIVENDKKDIAAANMAVQEAKRQLDAVVAQLGDRASPQLKAALQDLSGKSVNSKEDVGPANAAADQGKAAAAHSEGMEMQQQAGGLIAGLIGLGVAGVAIANSKEFNKAMESFKGIVDVNKLVDSMTNDALFEKTKNGVNAAKEKIQSLGI